MIVYIYNIGVDLYNGFNGLRHRINWTYFTVLDGLAHPLYSKFYSILILSAALIVEAFILLRPEKTVKEDNAINATIVNEDSLIVQII